MSEADPRIQSDAILTEAAAAEPERKSRPWRFILMLSVPLLLALVGGYFWLTSGRYVSTDNAYVQQDMVSVAPEVSGAISEVLVRENQQVRRGDLLFKIDPRPFRIALAQAEAQIAAAEVQVNEMMTRSAGTGGDIQGAEANLTYAQREYSRYEALLRQGFTTRSRYDEAWHDVQEARERLANARADAANAQAALRGGGPSSQPALQAARVAREQALLNLRRTLIRAPSDGFVSQTDRLQVGAAAVLGVPVVTLVRRGTTYVEANYKETDLANMYVGQPAEITLDAIRGSRGPCREHRRGNGSHSRDPRPECERQLGQGDPARAGPHRHRRRARTADDRRPLRRGQCRHERAVPATRGRRHALAMQSYDLSRSERALVTTAVILAMLMQVLDTTIANVALPHMQTSLGATRETVNWVLTSYIVASAIAIPITGWLAEQIGRKRLFVWSVIAFTIASLLCAMAQNLTEMVIFRVIQGVAGAFLVPLAQAVMFDINPPERHGRAMAMFGAGVMIGPILGPVLGGWLTENFDWRWVFLVNLPIGLLAMVMLIRFFPPRPG
jgi:multidrug resistance protein